MKNIFRKMCKTASEGVRKFSLLLLSVVILSSIAIPFNAVEAEVSPEYTDNIIISQEDHYDLKDTYVVPYQDDSSDEQVGTSSTMTVVSMTDNIVGGVFAKMFNDAFTSKETGAESSKDKQLDVYPIDHHDRSYYGDSPRVRDLSNDNYLVYRDSYLLFSEADSATYTISYSDDRLTAYVSPAIALENLKDDSGNLKTGVVFLGQSIGDDTILVFNGTPQVEDERLVVPLVAMEKIVFNQLFSDGKLKYSRKGLDHEIPFIDWTTDISGTNWSGTINPSDTQVVTADLEFDIWNLTFALDLYFQITFDFDITTKGASNGREASRAAKLSFPVEDIFAGIFYFNVQAQFDESPIQVKGTLLTDFAYSLAITGANIDHFRTPVTISELTVLNGDYNKDIDFYLGTELEAKFGVIYIDILGHEFGPILSLEQDSTGGCYIYANHGKDQYDKPDLSKNEIHVCTKNGEDGCLSLYIFEKNKCAYEFTIDLYFDSWTYKIKDPDEKHPDGGVNNFFYNSYTFESGMQPGQCPNIGYRINAKVDTNLQTSTKGATVSYTPVADHFDPFASAVVDDNNKAVLFAPAGAKLQVKAELTSPHDKSWKISNTADLDKTDMPQDVHIVLEIPEKNVYFKNSVSRTASNWPNDVSFAPFLSESVQLPNNIPTLSGMQFLNWNTAEDGSGTSYAPSATLTLDDDLTLWAQWDKAEKSWYVIYDANGGSNAPDPQIIQQGTDATLSDEIPSGGSLKFEGWALKVDAAEPDYQSGDKLPYDSKKNVVVLYALWSLAPVEEPVYISFDPNGVADAQLPANFWVKRGSWVKLRGAAAPMGSEYAFLGWSKNKTAEKPEYEADHYYSFDQDTKLYAIWEKQDTVTLTFKDSLPDEASGIPDPITIIPSMSRDVMIPSQSPQKDGRIFTSWNTAKDGSGKAYAPGTVFTLEKDTTLWAQWKIAENSWYVIYDANGGYYAPGSQIVPLGENAVLSLELPEADDMTFIGWTPDLKTLKPIYQPGDILPYDSEKNVVVLYAMWELDPAQRPVVISFDANGGLPDTIPDSLSVPKGVWTRLPKHMVTWDPQHDFLGWSTDKKDSEPKWKAGGAVVFNEDTTLYAIWHAHYKVIEGAGSIWVKDSGKTQRFVADGNYKYFKEFMIDGKVFSNGVNIYSGSTVADISADGMETLSVGTHTVTFVYIDGEASATFTVMRQVPPTGDASYFEMLPPYGDAAYLELKPLKIGSAIVGFALLCLMPLVTRRK